MSDAMPNYKVEIQRVRFEIAQQEAAIQQQSLNILELGDRLERHRESRDAARRAISEKQDKLKSLEKTHGKVTDADIGAAEEAIDAAVKEELDG